MQDQQERQLDLNLIHEFPKSTILGNRERFETNIANLINEHIDISTDLKMVITIEKQIEEIQKVFQKPNRYWQSYFRYEKTHPRTDRHSW